MELGVGRTAFASLSDGDPVELVAGPQGGWHLDVGLRFGAGSAHAGFRLVYDAVRLAGDPVSYTTVADLGPSAVLDDGDGWVRLGDRVVLDISSPTDVVGRVLVVRVTAELANQTWSDERRIVVVDDE